MSTVQGPSHEVAAAPVTTDSAAWHGGSPIWLIPASRSIATEAYGPLWLAPREARIVAVGRHNFLPMGVVAWISDRNKIVVSVEGNGAEAGRSVLIRVWTRERGYACRVAVLEAQRDRAIATAVMGDWDGLPIAGITLQSLIAPGEEL